MSVWTFYGCRNKRKTQTYFHSTTPLMYKMLEPSLGKSLQLSKHKPPGYNTDLNHTEIRISKYTTCSILTLPAATGWRHICNVLIMLLNNKNTICMQLSVNKRQWPLPLCLSFFFSFVLHLSFAFHDCFTVYMVAMIIKFTLTKHGDTMWEKSGCILEVYTDFISVLTANCIMFHDTPQ